METDVLLRVHLCEHLMDPLLVSPSHPMKKSLSKLDIKSICGTLHLSIVAHFPHLPATPSPRHSFLSKNNFGEYFMGYIASVSQGEWHAMTTDKPRTPASARRQPFFSVCLPDTPTSSFFPASRFPSVRDTTVLSAESLAPDHLAVSLKFSMTTELLLIHLTLLAKMPTYG